MVHSSIRMAALIEDPLYVFIGRKVVAFRIAIEVVPFFRRTYFEFASISLDVPAGMELKH